MTTQIATQHGSMHKARLYARVIALSFEMALRQNVTDAFIIFTVLLQPLIIALLAMWMLKDRGGDYVIFVVVGSGMTGLWSSLLFISGNSITVERWTGTLESIVGQPTPISVILFGKNLANVFQSLGSMVLAYALAALIFGYSIHFEQPLVFIVGLAFTVISFVSFGLMIAPIFILNPAVQSFQNALEYPMYILGGFLFPVLLLPNWTTPISYVVAPYWAARILHAASEGTATSSEIALCIGMMTVLTSIYLIISRTLFNIMLVKARVDGTLDME